MSSDLTSAPNPAIDYTEGSDGGGGIGVEVDPRLPNPGAINHGLASLDGVNWTSQAQFVVSQIPDIDTTKITNVADPGTANQVMVSTGPGGNWISAALPAHTPSAHTHNTGDITNVADPGALDQVLRSDGGGNWISGTVPGHIHNTADITDLETAGAVNNVLKSNGGANWVNGTVDYSELTGTPVLPATYPGELVWFGYFDWNSGFQTVTGGSTDNLNASNKNVAYAKSGGRWAPSGGFEFLTYTHPGGAPGANYMIEVEGSVFLKSNGGDGNCILIPTPAIWEPGTVEHRFEDTSNLFTRFFNYRATTRNTAPLVANTTFGLDCFVNAIAEARIGSTLNGTRDFVVKIYRLPDA